MIVIFFFFGCACVRARAVIARHLCVKLCVCVCVCWELLLPTISSKPLFEQAADSSLDYYLDFHSFTERHSSFVLSLRLYLPLARYYSFSWMILFTSPVVPSGASLGSTRGQ